MYLDEMYGPGHSAKIDSQNKFVVTRNGKRVPGFRIVYIRGSPGTPNHSGKVREFPDVAHVTFEEIRKENARLMAKITGLEFEKAELKSRNAELRERVAKLEEKQLQNVRNPLTELEACGIDPGIEDFLHEIIVYNRKKYRQRWSQLPLENLQTVYNINMTD
ncbi:3789_t:CDS:2 [Cetraspora pellucida]|uniref:3789_t:CDS:1 n=1 Tax=Cetraspora pellucida TaxID=1433469 RepID=A0ACA9PTH5_9GLOM|nr:3789_t:CDS:2 [Cetraspora pellucida]